MASTSDVDDKKATSVYDFTVKDTYGKDVPLEKYRGNVLLIVNIASQCGLAKSNYAKLTQLHKEYYDKGVYMKNPTFNGKLRFIIFHRIAHFGIPKQPICRTNARKRW